MLTKFVTIGILCLFIFAGMSCQGGKAQPKLKTIPIIINNVDFIIEVAETPQEQMTGLMYRESMGEYEGMIFVYERDKKLGFYMQNTLIPLSIAFINTDGKIIQIEDMEPLSKETISSRISVRYALEVNQGVFEKNSIKEGDKVIFPKGFPF